MRSIAPELQLDIPKRLENRFKHRAKDVFPKEAFGFLLGTIAGNLVTVDDIWMPSMEELAKFSTRSSISAEGMSRWLLEAMEDAKEEDLLICGDIHSHPFRFKHSDGIRKDRIQSETDLDGQQALAALVFGICNVEEQRNGKLRASIRWWGRTIGLSVSHIVP